MKNDRHVGGRIRMLSILIRRRTDEMMPPEITGMHGRIIGFLCRSEDKEIFQRDIEAEFRLRRSTASGILQLMEKNGLLRREPVPYDARLKRLVLTPKALAMDRSIRECIGVMEARMTKGVSDEELEQFFAVTEKIRKNLED